MSAGTLREEDVEKVEVVWTQAGSCLRARLRTTGRPVAIRLVTCRSVAQRVLVPVHSDRVLVPLGVLQTRFFMGLVCDWMPEGSLHTLLYETLIYPEVPLCLRLRILSDVAEGLSHLHDIPVSHQALKATNVVLDHQYRAKLCDWGVSGVPDCGSPSSEDVVYVSPEVLTGSVPSVEADMYSFGVLFHETLNEQRHHHGITQMKELVLYTKECKRLGEECHILPKDTPQGHTFNQLVTECWNSDPQCRTSAKEFVLELKKALMTFDPVAPHKAALQLKERKERALLSCKYSLSYEQTIDLNNMEGCGAFKNLKKMMIKTLPVNVPKSTQQSSSNNLSSHPVLHCRSHRIRCCLDRATPPTGLSAFPSVPVHRGNSALQPCSPVWPRSTCSSPSSPKHGSPSPPSAYPFPPQRRSSCCRLLQEKRGAVIQAMTEGRLNHILDVLRSRQALTRESYELIQAGLTLDARTRALLDTCECLGEKASALVVSTLRQVGHAHLL
ncbi:receptor-interacting serine/threonine-protein kinase 2 isoform X1 [Denticeps clupeoides]|uniref:Uncharacterized protein n=1 Tax=Denticeps clupeoides TaxID=299321 RepID=A0AAY4BDI7_9TELE|nr:receptor-interacting serine/threonine-protein kinase 2-like isoform X1 [Denticeps clupeoides]